MIINTEDESSLFWLLIYFHGLVHHQLGVKIEMLVQRDAEEKSWGISKQANKRRTTEFRDCTKNRDMEQCLH